MKWFIAWLPKYGNLYIILNIWIQSYQRIFPENGNLYIISNIWIRSAFKSVYIVQKYGTTQWFLFSNRIFGTTKYLNAFAQQKRSKMSRGDGKSVIAGSSVGEERKRRGLPTMKWFIAWFHANGERSKHPAMRASEASIQLYGRAK